MESEVTEVKLITSDECLYINCCVCTQNEAEKYCTQCQDYYCSRCDNVHEKVPSLRGHELVDKSNFPAKPAGSLPSFPTQRCPVHPSQVIAMFCMDHDEVACPLCIALNHRTCVNISTISEETVTMYNKSEVNATKRDVASTKDELEGIQRMKQEEIAELQESLQIAKDSVKKFREELDQVIERIEKETIKRLETEYAKIKASLENEIKKLRDLIKDIDDCTERLAKSEGNSTQEFVCVKTLKKLRSTFENSQTKPSDIKQISLNFLPDDNFKQFLEDIQTFGSINEPVPKTGLYEIMKLSEVSAKHENDTEFCNIYGSCIVESKYLLLADNGNKNLKRFDVSDLAVKDYVSFQARPNAVCEIDSTKAAVSMDDSSIKFVDLGEQMTTGESLYLKHPCFGLAHCNGKLLVSDAAESLYIHDMKGQELRRVKTDLAGTNIFQSCQHIVASSDGCRVFVTDYCKALLALDTHGVFISKTTKPGVSG